MRRPKGRDDLKKERLKKKRESLKKDQKKGENLK
jgi:hypothetical protein